MTAGPPARRPCRFCPYRRDVPSAVWSPAEYAKLPRYDLPTWQQPAGVFFCHRFGLGPAARVCGGWAGCHPAEHLLSLRLAGADSRHRPGALMTGEAIKATMRYVSPIPLFASGAEAALHGLSEMADPSPAALAAAAIIAGYPDRLIL